MDDPYILGYRFNTRTWSYTLGRGRTKYVSPLRFHSPTEARIAGESDIAVRRLTDGRTTAP